MSEDNLYATHASLIETVLRASCRVHRLVPDHADEFRSWAILRLLDHDQAILRKFAGRSALRTYLVTVVERLYLDWRNHEWGKWRPSSEARRAGEVAVELERLVLRDRRPLHEAVQVLVDRGVAADADACYRAWERLPRRPWRQRVDDEELADRPAPAVDPVEADARREQRAALLGALDVAMRELSDGDAALLRLRFWGGVPVSTLAVMREEDQKQLYRRFERLLRDLRRRLGELGVEGQVGCLFEGFDPDESGEADRMAVGTALDAVVRRPGAAADRPVVVETHRTGPSPLKRAGGTHG